MKLFLLLLTLVGIFHTSVFSLPDIRIGKEAFGICDLKAEQEQLNWEDLNYVCYHFRDSYCNTFFKRKDNSTFKHCLAKNCYPHINGMKDYDGWMEDQHSIWNKIWNFKASTDFLFCFTQKGLFKTLKECKKEYDNREGCDKEKQISYFK